MSMLDWLKFTADEWADVTSVDAPGAIADAVSSLARGMAAVAQRQAAVALDAATQARDGGVALLALRLGWLAEVRRYNHLPSGRGLSSADAAARWSGLDRLKQIEATIADIRSWPGSSSVRPEAQWLEFASGLPVAAACLRDAIGTPFHAMMLQLQTRTVEGRRTEARALSPSAEAFAVRSLAVLCRFGNDRERADRTLAQARQLHDAAGDRAGVAACDALACEWLVAPWSAASVRNLEPMEAAYPTSQLSWTIEQAEGDTSGVDIDAAHDAIARARAEAHGAAAQRVLGSLALSEAGLHRQRRDMAAQLRSTDEAVALFAAAQDGLHLQLARTHRLLAQVDAGQPEDLDTAAAIGAWGGGEGSFSYALGLGLVLTRAGRQALLRDGDYERAEASLQLALALNRALGAPLRVTQTLADLGEVQQVIGQRSRARTLQADAMDGLLALSSQIPAAADRLALLSQQVYLEALEHQDAEGMEAAIALGGRATGGEGGLVGSAIGIALSASHGQAAVLVPLYRGVAARRRGDGREADVQFDLALAAARAGNDTEARQLEAVVLGTCQRFGEARAAFDRYVAARDGGQGAQARLLSLAESLGGDHASAETAIAKVRHLENDFSLLVRLRDHSRAAERLAQLQALAGDDWYREDARPWNCLSDLGEMCEGLGRHDEAVRHYQQGIALLEERRTMLSREELKIALSGGPGAQSLYFQATRAQLRRALAATDPAVRREALEQAFRLSEQGRARALLDLMALNLRAPPDADSPVLRHWRECQSRAEVLRGLLARARSGGDATRIDALRRQVSEADQAARQSARALAEHQPALAQLTGEEAPVLDLHRAVALLPEGTALLQYMTLGDELLLWALTRNGMQAPTIVSLRAVELTGFVHDFFQSCRTGAPMRTLLAQSERLSGILLKPLDAVLRQCRRLVVVPYGDLFRLPFGALRWEGAWLAQTHVLTQLFSASVLEPLTAAGAPALAGQPVLAVGGPAAMRWTTLDGEVRTLGDLPGARDEARYVARVLDGRALVASEATKPAVLDALADHRIFHFATHGILFDEAPLLSGIALADGEFLTVHELMARRFRAELVTLSACDTGAGVLTAGQELIGLSRGLLAAGAKRVVVSLWPVKDGATAVLMARFADALKQGADPADAMQAAQRALRALDAPALATSCAALRDLGTFLAPVKEMPGGDHPQHWAAFVVVGV